jgi:small-conductance mechanosensitive channel
MSPNDAVQIFGVRLVGVTPENGKKLLFTIIFVLAVLIASRILRGINALIFRGSDKIERAQFWIRQAIKLLTTAVMLLGVLSIWFNDPNRLATALGLFSAGLAFALQRVITAIAAYFVLLRGRSFTVGDRIMMGGVRGDVIALDLVQTTIMEMGQPPGEQGDAPSMWVRARQYTGRIVTITNDKIFDEPVYNYSREFPYLWDEMQIPISYNSDRRKAEEILLDVARKHTVKIEELSEAALKEMERRYFMKRAELHPRVFWRLTDNWIELSVRFIAHDSGIRDLKDKMRREIIERFDQAKIGIASSTYEVVGFPPIRIESWPNAPDNQRRAERTQHSGADGPGT